MITVPLREGKIIIISLESYYTEIPATKAILDPMKKLKKLNLIVKYNTEK